VMWWWRVGTHRSSRKSTGMAQRSHKTRKMGALKYVLGWHEGINPGEIPPSRRNARGAQDALRGPTRHNSVRRKNRAAWAGMTRRQEEPKTQVQKRYLGHPAVRWGKGLVESVDAGLFAAAAMEVAHGDVDIDFAAGSFDAEDHGLSIHAARKAFLVHMDFGRKDLEAEALVIE